MKIIFLNRFFFPDISATSQMLSDLAFFLAGQGHEVTVITSRQLYDAPNAGLPAKETVNGVAVRRVAASTFGRGNLVGRALDYLTFYLSAAFALWRCAGPETIVVAKTDPAKGAKGTSLIVVDTTMTGFAKGKRLKKMGLKGQDTSELFFDNVEVPAENLLGQENNGFVYLMQELPWERLQIAIAAVRKALALPQLDSQAKSQ